jgi:PAS domain S-box-containing protein
MLRLLFVEDLEGDVRVLLSDLARGGHGVEWERVDTREAMAHALDREQWDAVLSELRLTSFSGPEALALCEERGLDLPFIIVSGSENEAEAAEALRAGAHDFIGKEDLTRLRPALFRALREAECRRARKQAERALEAAEARYRQLVESIHAVVWRADPRTLQFSFVSAEAEAMLGYPASRWREPGFLEERLHPDDREQALAAWRRVVQGHEPQHDGEYRMTSADGRTLWLRSVVSMARGGGAPSELVGVMLDVSERRSLEAQLLQSQKIDAVGRLAGGIAHDFNNLLSVIIGHSALALTEAGIGERPRKRLEQIQTAAGRAAGLTGQLLAFSRKQILQPRLLDLNAVTIGLDEMLRRLLGEDIELVVLCGRALCPVKADPGQVEQVIVNLAINARDAMPSGGTLIIETANVELDESYTRLHVGSRPGPHVMLAVSDTGIGMGSETLKHLFEPFFTTKQAGKGTGLGLATVYGIVKQSGGYIGVYSEIGRGSTFKVYLPKAEQAGEQLAMLRTKEAAVAPPSGSETVLVVEDEPGLRVLVREVLEGSGYAVLEAGSPAEALAASSTYRGPIDLLLTDVVLPQMGGAALASRLRADRSFRAVLYVSGYTDQVINRRGVLEPGTPFLQKPFTPDALLRKVREALDAERSAARPATSGRS